MKLSEQVKKLEDKHAALEAGLAEKVVEVANAETALKALEGDLANLKGGSATLIDNLQATLKEKVSEHAALSSQHEELVKSVAEAKEKIAELDSQMAVLDAQLAADQAKEEEQSAVISKLEAEAEADEATLAELEKTCLALTEELQETEAKLASAQEMERKSSREYIAYEKHRAKAEAAKKAREGGAGGGKGFKTSGLS